MLVGYNYNKRMDEMSSLICTGTSYAKRTQLVSHSLKNSSVSNSVEFFIFFIAPLKFPHVARLIMPGTSSLSIEQHLGERQYKQ